MSLSKERLLIGWGEKKKTCIEHRDFTKPAFYCPNFFLTDPLPWIEYAEWRELSAADLLNEFKSVSVSYLPECQWTLDPKEKFKFLFQDLMELLEGGVLQKAVPYLFTRSPALMTKDRLCHCIRKGIEALQQGLGFLYGHWDGDEDEGVLGMTPELLFSHAQQEPKKISTMALAGTCPVGDFQNPQDPQETFIKNEKELQEHQLVVEGIKQALHSLGQIQIKSLQVTQIPPLCHLMTPIEVELNGSFHFDTFVRHLHPTPALGAWPMERGKQWLQKYQEHIPRHYYGAPLGLHYPQQGAALCLVGIRNIQWNPLEMFIGAGCGVIQKSTFEKEWAEIQLKIGAIRGIFGV